MNTLFARSQLFIFVFLEKQPSYGYYDINFYISRVFIM